MIKSILLFLALSISALASNVTCTGSSGTDISAIQASLNAGGTTTLINTGNHCNISTTTLQTAANNTTITSSTGAQIDYTTSGFNIGKFALSINHNNVTVTNIIWNGGGLFTSQNNQVTPQSGGTITGNTFQNITSGTTGIQANGYWLSFTISNNQFKNITSVPLASINSGTNIENGVGGYVCNYPTAGANQCGGNGIENFNGVDQTSITNNTFDLILGDGMHVTYNWCFGSTGGNYTTCKNNHIDNNTFTRIHRIAIESQGTSSGICPGGCSFGHYTTLTGFTISNNYAYNFIGTYGDTYFLSIPIGTSGMFVLNNTGVMDDITCTGGGFCPGYSIEESGDNGTYQGNVLSVGNTVRNWSVYFMTGQSNATTTIQNNMMNGTGSPAYYGCEPAGNCSQSGVRVTTFNFTATACATPTSCHNSTLSTPVFTTANNQSFPSGGNGTWSLYATDEISIKNVAFYIDGSSTPTITQAQQDLNSAFTTTPRWLYHATFNTTGLSNGSHTIQAVATDVSGATQSASQTFTVGSGSFPGAALAPTSQGFGNITQSTTSAARTTVLTNNGGATLNISGITLTGTNAADFTITGASNCGATLSASASCNIVVTFTPSALGARSASISIADNAAGSPQAVPLTGTGAASSAGCPGSILANCNFTSSGSPSVTSWLFAGTAYAGLTATNTGTCGLNSGTVTATSSVPGGQNVELYQDNLTFTPGATYSVSFQASINLAQAVNVIAVEDTSPFTYYGNWGGGAVSWMPNVTTGCNTYTTSFTVINNPTAASGRITMQMNNLVTGNRIDVTNFNVQQIGGVPTASLTPSTLAFPRTGLTFSSTPSSITLSNLGAATLTISGISFTGTNPGDFSQTNTCGSSLAAGLSCLINVTFTPTVIGSRSATLSIADNAAGTPHTVPLTGVSTEVGPIVFPYLDHATAAVGLKTATNSNAIRIRYTASPATCEGGTGGTLQNTIDTGILAVYGQISIGGLAPNTTYDVCPEVSKNSGSTWSSGAGALFTTAVLPATHPSLPIKPIKFDTSYPDTSTYGTYTVASNCSDFGTAYGQAITNWALPTPKGTVILTPPGGTCTTTTGNPFAFSQRPPDVHQWDTTDVSLPSTITWSGHPFSEGDLVSFGRTYASLVTYPSSTSCDVGYSLLNGGGIQSGQRYPVHVIDSSHFQVYCLPATQYDPDIQPPTPPIMVFSNVGTTSGGQHFLLVPWKKFLNTNDGLMEWKRVLANGTPTPQIVVRSASPDNQLPPEHTQITPAWNSKVTYFVDPATNASTTFNPNKGFMYFNDPDPNVEAIVGNYHIGPGIGITTQNYNASVHSSDPASFQYILITQPWDGQIVFDRFIWHMLGAPNRETAGFYWNGSNMGIVDSYWDGMDYFHANNSGLAPTRNSNTQFTIGTGFAFDGFGKTTLATPAVCTISGSGTGTVFAYFNMLSSNAFTVAVPAGITANCTGTTAVSAVAGANTGMCNVSNNWPKTASGEPTVAQIACITVSAGVIGTATAATPYDSLWNAEGCQCMTGGIGPGPYVFDHNYSDGAGIPWHWDASGAAAFRGDFTIRRNYLFTNPKYMTGSSTSDGGRYFVRQPMEHKGGQRIDFRGNILDTIFRDDTPDGTFYALTPLDGAWISDVNFVSNTWKHGSGVVEGINTTCPSDLPSSAPCARPAVRYNFSNNLIYDIDGYKYSAYNPGGSNGPGVGWNFQLYGVGDMIVSRNSYASNRGINPGLFTFDGPAIEGYQHTNNIEWITGVPTQTPFTIWSQVPVPPTSACAGLINIALLNCGLTQGPGTTLYNFGQNLIAGGYTDSSVPSGQITTSAMSALLSGLSNSYLATGTVAGTTSAIGWANPTIDSLSNYCLTYNSSYNAGHNSFTHANDLGFDCNKLNADQGSIKVNGVGAVTSTGATVSYYAADSQVCHVLYSATNDISTTSQAADTGGNRSRNVALTGLTPNTKYYGWVVGPGNSVVSQKTFSFATH